MPDANSFLTAFYIVCSTLMGIWGFIKVVKDVKKTNDDEVKRQERIDNVVKIVEDNHDKWDKGLADMEQGRQQIIKRYDGRLNAQDAETQQLFAMQCISLRAQDAILEALVEQGIGNGEIRTMHKELRDFILNQVQRKENGSEDGKQYI